MEGSKRIRLLVAEDHAGVRRALVKMIGLQGDMEVVGEAADGREAVRLALSLDPDVVLLDMRMPGMDGVRAIQELRRSGCAARIIVLSAHEDESYISDAMKGGADSYLLKGMSMRAVIDAVRSVADGTMVLPPDVAEPLARKYREQDETIKALQGLLEAGTRRGALLEEACRCFKELLEADEAAVFALEGEDGEARHELLVCSREEELSERPSVDQPLSSLPSLSELRSLAGMAKGERLVVCNALREPGEEGEAASSLNVIAVPLRPRNGETCMVTCLRKRPFNPQPSAIRHAELLASQVTFMLEACHDAGAASSRGKRVVALERAVMELLYIAARGGDHSEFLEKVALLLEAKASILAWNGGEPNGELELFSWGLGKEEARAALREIEAEIAAVIPDFPAMRGGTAAHPLYDVVSVPGLGGHHAVLVMPFTASGRIRVPVPERGHDGVYRVGPTAGRGLPAGERRDAVNGSASSGGRAPFVLGGGLLCAIGHYRKDLLEGKERLLQELAVLAALLQGSIPSRPGS